MRYHQLKGDDIHRLDEDQLPLLLNELLKAECRQNKIPLNLISHTDPSRTKVGDGGRDAKVAWDTPPPRTDYFPGPNIVFQCKAQTMKGADCKKEVKTQKGQLKPEIKKVLDEGGAYIVFCGRSRGRETPEDLEEKILEGINDTGWSKPAESKPIIKFYDSEKITNWCNEHFNVVLWVKEQLRFLKPPCVTFQRWSLSEEIIETSFETDEQIEKLQEKLAEQISKSSAKAIRLYGQSGIGKTRLLYETFQNENLAQHQSALLYTNAQEYSSSRGAFSKFNHFLSLCD